MTFDCDAFDAAIMPAVMSPSPGGVAYYEAIDLIATVSSHGRLAGFDLIEFVPERDHDHVAAYMAARVVCHVIGSLARRP